MRDTKRIRCFVAFAILALLVSQDALADYYWDTNGTGTGSGNVGGTWDSGTNWTTDSTGASSTIGWTDGNIARFSAGTDGTGAWNVTVSGTVDPNSIFFDQNGNKTISGGSITTAGGLTISSAGRSNSNQFFINSLLTGSGNLTLAAHGDISATGGGTPGNLELGNTSNDFVGTVDITSGIVSFQGDGVFGNTANGITFSGFSGLVATGTRTLPSTRTITLASGGAKIFRVYGSQTFTVDGQITGTTGPGLQKTDGGTLVLTNTANNFGTASSNPHVLIGAGTLRTGASEVIPNNSIVVLYSANTPTLDLNGNTETIGGLGVGSAGDTAPVVQLGSGGNLIVTGNGDAAGITDLPGQYYGRIRGTGNVTYNNTLGAANGQWDWFNSGSDFTGNVTITRGRLRVQPNAGADAALGNSANDLIFDGAPISTLGNGQGTASFQVTNGTNIALNSGRDIVLNSGKEGTMYVWGATTTTINGKITGAGALRKEDSGILLLTNTANDYTGNTTIVFGTIQLGAAGVIPDSNRLIIGTSDANFPVLDLNNNDETVRMISGNTSGSSFTNGRITLGSGNLTIAASSGTAGGFAGNISGNGGVIKTGGVTLGLSGTNTFAGKLINTGTGAIDGNSGIIAFNNQVALGAAAADAVTLNDGGTLFNANTDSQGGFTSASTLTVSDRGIVLGTGVGGVLRVWTGSGFNISSVISGSGNLTKVDGGNLTLSGTNNFAGKIVINNGILGINADAALGAVPGSFVADSITINGQTLANMTAADASNGFGAGHSPTLHANRGITLGSGGGTIRVGYGGTTMTINGAITGAGALTKSDVGTLELNGTDTYLGNTTVSGGKLLVNGTHTTGGSYTVNGGTTLGGTGSIGTSAVSVSGTLSPGASIESLGMGALTFNSNSTFAYELRSDGSFNGDLAYVTGGLNLSGTVTLTLTDTNPGILAAGSKLTLISSTGAWNGGLFTYLGNPLTNNSMFTLGGNQWLFKYNDTSGGSNFSSDQSGANNFVTMQVVPEPASQTILLLGGLVLWYFRRTPSAGSVYEAGRGKG